MHGAATAQYVLSATLTDSLTDSLTAWCPCIRVWAEWSEWSCRDGSRASRGLRDPVRRAEDPRFKSSGLD